MQTFLPFPSFLASATALDDRRLGKQRVETFQILRALVFPTYGWKNHPAVAMWRGFTPALVGYGLTVCREWERRGYADAVAGALLEFTGGEVPDVTELRLAGRLPTWLGDPAVHASHRAALLRKDRAYYRDLFPGRLAAPDSLPYFWPAPLFGRWPVRRSGRLPVADALAAAKLEAGLEVEAAVTEAVAALDDGAEEVAVDTAPVALAAILAFEAPGLWLTDGPDVHPDVPAPFAAPARLERIPGKLSTSIARAPGPADAEAMAQEAGLDAGIIVHPRERLADPRVAERLAAAAPRVVAAPVEAGGAGYVLSRHGPRVSGAAAPTSPRRSASSRAG